MRKALHFGAGSIGRGFIGDLLHSSGYELVFADVDEKLKAHINSTNSYQLFVIEEDYRPITIDHVSVLSPMTEFDLVADTVVTADIITTAVRVENLEKVAPVLAEGLAHRIRSGGAPVNVIPCENAIGNDKILRDAVLEVGTLNAEELDSIARFVGTSIDRLVLPSEGDDGFGINIGVDYEIVMEASSLVDPTSRPIEGAIYADVLEKYIERKLFIINGGHVWAGYVAALRGFTIMQDALDDEEIVNGIYALMREAAAYLSEKWSFDLDELNDYIAFAVHRFQTPGITDYITRVCRSPIRKLRRDERLVAPALGCISYGLPHEHYIEGIAAGYLYTDPDDAEAVELAAFVAEQGISAALTKYSGLSEDEELHREIVEFLRVKEEVKQK